MNLKYKLNLVIFFQIIGGESIVINAIYRWMLLCGILCVPGEISGVTAVADEPGDILNQEYLLKQAEILGLNVLKATKLLQK